MYTCQCYLYFYCVKAICSFYVYNINNSAILHEQSSKSVLFRKNFNVVVYTLYWKYVYLFGVVYVFIALKQFEVFTSLILMIV